MHSLSTSCPQAVNALPWPVACYWYHVNTLSICYEFAIVQLSIFRLFRIVVLLMCYQYAIIMLCPCRHVLLILSISYVIKARWLRSYHHSHHTYMYGSECGHRHEYGWISIWTGIIVWMYVCLSAINVLPIRYNPLLSDVGILSILYKATMDTNALLSLNCRLSIEYSWFWHASYFLYGSHW